MKREWWHNKVAYQIWPKSFYDSNGDGIGDIPGIIEKLDGLKALGIDILWLSPVYPSPLADEGYDISDYEDIDPRFGTMADMDRLLEEARKRDMHVLMDLVVNHCSDEHVWFKRACEDPEGRYGKYFYIRKLDKDGKPPCNWRSYFGGPAWDKLPGHDDYVYLHVFHKRQPDLNWENPEVRQEIYAMINRWLDRGVAGFRIDAIINIKKALPFKDYPVDSPDGLSSLGHMLKEADGVLDFLDEMAAETFHKHNAFAIAELFDNKPEDLPRYIGENGCFSTIFDFAPEGLGRDPALWPWRSKVTADQWRDAVFKSQAQADGVGFMANIIENHDEPRGVSRYLPDGEHSETAKKMLAGLSVLLRGLPFLYQGQEIGMENKTFASIDEVDDCSSLGVYRMALEAGLTPEQALDAISSYCRDNARTPYQWTDGREAGFTTGTAWLPVNPNYTEINLAEQMKRPDSLWHFYQQLIALRKDPEWEETMVDGRLRPCLRNQHNLMAYTREGEKRVLVIGNWQKEARTVTLDEPLKCVLLSNLPEVHQDGRKLTLDGFQLVVAAL